MFSSTTDDGQAMVRPQSLPAPTSAASVGTISYQVAGGFAGSSSARRNASRL